MTEPSPSQTEPTEPAEGEQDAPDPAAGPATPPGKQPPRWSESQPEPAPWYLGRPGNPAGPTPGGPGQNPGPGGRDAGPNGAPPNGRPTQPSQGSATQPGGDGQNGVPTQGQNGGVPAWTGRMPERGGSAGQGGQGGQGQNGQGGQNGQQPGSGAQRPQGPGNGAPQGRPSPWHDPNRYGPPQQQRPDPRLDRQRPGAPAEPPGPLDLRTRWARGLALGATACMLIALWYVYANIAAFPTFLISAAVGLVLAMAGLWFGVFAQREAMRKNKRAPEAVGAIVWSSIAAFITLVILAYSMVFYAQLNQYANCVRSATTIALENKCVTDYRNSFGQQN